MASGTITLNKSASSGSYIVAKIEWSSSADKTANNSDVTAKIYIRKDNPNTTLTIATEGTWTYKLTVNGSSLEGSASKSVLTDWIYLGTKTVNNISHNDNGSKSITISGSVSAPSGTSFAGHTTSGSKSVALDTIPRASTMDSLTCSTSYFNGTLTYKYTPKSASYYNRQIIYLNYNQAFITIRTTNLGKKSTSQQSGTIDFSTTELSKIYTALKTATSAKIRVIIRTFSDSDYSTKIGSDSYKEITLSIPTSVKPTVTLTVSPANDNTWIKSKNIYVKGYSGLSAEVSATPGTGASISSYSITGGDYSSSNNTLSVTKLDEAGSLKLTGTAKDSRGRSGSTSKTITVHSYSAPTITSLTVERGTYDAGWAPDDKGSDVKVSFKTVLALSDYDNKYSAIFKFNNTTKISDYGNTSGIGSGVSNTVYFFNVGTESSYVLTLTATDAVGKSSSAVIIIPSMNVTMEFNSSGKGIAFGKTSEKDAFECAMDAEFTGETYVKGNLHANHIARTSFYDFKDFNELIYATGYYPSTSAPGAANCANYPTNKTGVLEVISQLALDSSGTNWWGFAYQTYRTHDGEIYTRSYYSANGWTEWKKLKFE